MKYGPMAASTRQRLLQYAPYLSRNGVEIEMAPLLGDEHLINLAQGRGSDKVTIAMAYIRRLAQLLMRRDHDLVWVHYELFPYFPGVFERLVGLSRKPVIYDFDDAIFHMYDHHPNVVVRRVLGGKLGALLSRVDACACGNAYLADYAGQFCGRCEVIPTVVDTEAYRPLSAPRKSGPPVVGWIGSAGTWPYVEPLLPTLLPLLARHGARFKVVGAGPRAEGIVGVDASLWTEDSEIAQVQAMDIGIMPLPDEPWARGKCGYKLIQYMACGLPVVASPVGVNAQIVQDGVNGYLARENSQWASALETLLTQPELCARMGVVGRRRAVEEYSLASQEPRVLALIQSVLAAAKA